VEAFGWFTHSSEGDNIVAACCWVMDNETMPQDIREEAERTLNRLAVFNPSAKLGINAQDSPKL
jgi:hypothetical protein